MALSSTSSRPARIPAMHGALFQSRQWHLASGKPNRRGQWCEVTRFVVPGNENGLIKPKGYCVLRDAEKAGPVLEQELIGFIKQRLAPFKYPRWIEFIDELPKTASGKIQRYKLRELRTVP
jgi:hypothetical protein